MVHYSDPDILILPLPPDVSWAVLLAGRAGPGAQCRAHHGECHGEAGSRGTKLIAHFNDAALVAEVTGPFFQLESPHSPASKKGTLPKDNPCGDNSHVWECVAFRQHEAKQQRCPGATMASRGPIRSAKAMKLA